MTYDNDNIFAKILRGDIPCHKVYEDDKTLAFMDIMPMADGHVLVIPKCQAIEVTDMPLDYLTAVFQTAQKIIHAQRKVLNREGIVQMQLNNAQAGQSVFHYHIHLIPSSIYHLGLHEDRQGDPQRLAELAKQFNAAIEA